MERIAAEPEVTVRGLMTELTERGVASAMARSWNFMVFPLRQKSPPCFVIWCVCIDFRCA